MGIDIQMPCVFETCTCLVCFKWNSDMLVVDMIFRLTYGRWFSPPLRSLFVPRFAASPLHHSGAAPVLLRFLLSALPFQPTPLSESNVFRFEGKGIWQAWNLIFFCTVLAQIRRLPKSPRYLLVILQGGEWKTPQISAILRKTFWKCAEKSSKSWLAKLPEHVVSKAMFPVSRAAI